jgi:hypothetical protein
MKGKRQRVRRSRTNRAPIAVLNISAMDGDEQQEAERIDKDMVLAPGVTFLSASTLAGQARSPFFEPLGAAVDDRGRRAPLPSFAPAGLDIKIR